MSKLIESSARILVTSLALYRELALSALTLLPGQGRSGRPLRATHREPAG